MTTTLTKVAIILFIFCATTYASCNKNCVESSYSFQIGIKVTPNLDSVNINDTIWFEVNELTILKDLTTGNTIDYSNADNFGTALSVIEFVGGSVSNPGVTNAAQSFNYRLQTGTELTSLIPEKIKVYNFAETQGLYKFRVGIIPIKKGIFAIGIDNATNVFRKNDRCTKASFAIPLKETNNHIYFLQQNRPGYTPSGLELTNLYCFKVK